MIHATQLLVDSFPTQTIAHIGVGPDRLEDRAHGFDFLRESAELVSAL